MILATVTRVLVSLGRAKLPPRASALSLKGVCEMALNYPTKGLAPEARAEWEAFAAWCASSDKALAAYQALPKGPKDRQTLLDLVARFPDHIALRWGTEDKVLVTLKL